MEDSRIVDLYRERSEAAIRETAIKYENYCFSIAYRILSDSESAKETVNDTYLAAWNSIPPHCPEKLSVYLGKLTRRIAINLRNKLHAQKRGGDEVSLTLEELAECTADTQSIESELEAKAAAQKINAFVTALPQTERRVFLCRYWYFDSVQEISRRFGFSESKTKSMLYRTRQKLAAFLKKEGETYDF